MPWFKVIFGSQKQQCDIISGLLFTTRKVGSKVNERQRSRVKQIVDLGPQIVVDYKLTLMSATLQRPERLDPWGMHMYGHVCTCMYKGVLFP